MYNTELITKTMKQDDNHYHQQQHSHSLPHRHHRSNKILSTSILVLLACCCLLRDYSFVVVSASAQQEQEQQQQQIPPSQQEHEQDDERELYSDSLNYYSDDDPYELVRVVVTIKPKQQEQEQQDPSSSSTTSTATGTSANMWNTAVASTSSSSSSSSTTYLRSSSTGTSTGTTTTQTTTAGTSSSTQQFVPEPWLMKHYNGAKYISQIKRTKDIHTTVMTVDIPRYLIPVLEDDPFVESVLTDTFVYPNQPIQHDEHYNEHRQRILQSTSTSTSEEIGWGLPVVMGPKVSSTVSIPFQPMTNANGDTSNCLRVCIVDGGVLFNHPDIPKNVILGQSFNLPYQQTWDKPIYNHGTHIMGIMAAIANNNIGIQGVLGNHVTNMCFMIARVFDDHGNGQYDSYILNAVEWCADNDAKIINLSLGSPTSGTDYAKQVYDQIYANGTLVFSSSGNTYDSTYNYPASFDNVISVGAIDVAFQKASFSTYNDQVNIVAPGVAIKSTVSQASVIIPSTNQQFPISIMVYSTRINVPISGTVVNCGYAQSDFDCLPTTDMNGKFCLSIRGHVSYYEKALTCQRAGGAGLLIYNDIDEALPLQGTLNITLEWITIPVVGLTKSAGETIVSLLSSGTAVTTIISMVDPGYEEISGTSMATPFVAGVAAKIWSLRPQCTAEQVRQALFASAKKLTSTGTSTLDDTLFFGNGLVQAEGAYYQLLQMPFPCGEIVVTPPTSAPIPNTITNTNNGGITNASSVSLDPVTITSGNASSSNTPTTDTQFTPNDWW